MHDDVTSILFPRDCLIVWHTWVFIKDLLVMIAHVITEGGRDATEFCAFLFSTHAVAFISQILLHF